MYKRKLYSVNNNSIHLPESAIHSRLHSSLNIYHSVCWFQKLRTFIVENNQFSNSCEDLLILETWSEYYFQQFPWLAHLMWHVWAGIAISFGYLDSSIQEVGHWSVTPCQWCLCCSQNSLTLYAQLTIILGDMAICFYETKRYILYCHSK